MRALTRATAVVALLLICTSLTSASAASTSGGGPHSCTGPVIENVETDKARYAPGEPVEVGVDLDNSACPNLEKAVVVVEMQDLGKSVSRVQQPLSISQGKPQRVELTLRPPKTDFHGYRAEIQIKDANHQLLASGATAIDVSSSWVRFPRYGYLAHYDENVPAKQWIADLNRFHINGLQFYDFQYKHHLPLPPPELRKGVWRDIANRPTSGTTVLTLITEAKKRNMLTMAYNASYAAYVDALHDGSGVKLQWAAWPDAHGLRTEATIKSLPLTGTWATPRLLYMNQDSAGWRQYIFSRMEELFRVFPFDGWHIDSFGDPGAFAWEGSRIDYYAGFAPFADAAYAALHRPVLVNTVSGHGQAAVAKSSADFVYSELWPEDQPTYANVLAAADEIHAANPNKAIVFPAYLHKDLAERLRHDPNGYAHFDLPAVLLADAVMFSSGASHLELGDGYRMLSHPYFPADTAITPTPELLAKLRNYYDFLVAYQNYLRDGAAKAGFSISLTGAPQTSDGQPGAVWAIGRQQSANSIVHLINLTSLKHAEWRDDALNYPPPQTLHDVTLKVELPKVVKAGWASPDIDQGKWHVLEIRQTSQTPASYEVTIPELSYWTMVLFQQSADKN